MDAPHQEPVATPSNRTSYLLLLGTIVAGSALLLNRVRSRQNQLALSELPPSAPNGQYAPIVSGTLPDYRVSPITDTTHLLPAPLGYPAGGTNPAVTVERPVYGTPDATAPVPREEGTNWRLFTYEIAETLLLTIFIFVLMRTVIINYRIEGNSMEPNLHEGQHLIVNKAEYYLGGPQRGDVIVFEYPYSLPDDQKDYIKRVIGVPGDTVECQPNQILVNGAAIEEVYDPNDWSYTCSPQTLNANEYFVLGDNRGASSDSHQWGVLERRFIIGKAYLAYWPLNQIEIVPNADIEAPEPARPLAQN